MFGNALIGFLLAVGAAAWVYSKMMRKTGNNTKQAVITATIVGGVVFLVVASLLSVISQN